MVWHQRSNRPVYEPMLGEITDIFTPGLGLEESFTDTIHVSGFKRLILWQIDDNLNFK